jgi:hypothetical protein
MEEASQTHSNPLQPPSITDYRLEAIRDKKPRKAEEHRETENVALAQDESRDPHMEDSSISNAVHRKPVKSSDAMKFKPIFTTIL